MAEHFWTCQRRAGGVKCGWKNSARLRKCAQCGKSRSTRKRPAHLSALDYDYQHFVKFNGGDFCAICGKFPSRSRRLDRDHCHATGSPRGLLCARCNRQLPGWVTPEWLEKAADYLRKAPNRVV